MLCGLHALTLVWHSWLYYTTHTHNSDTYSPPIISSIVIHYGLSVQEIVLTAVETAKRQREATTNGSFNQNASGNLKKDQVTTTP